MYQTYHKKFPSIETLTSIEYLREMRIHHQSNPPQERKFILVDARSRAEQMVSMIPNAITLIQFEANLNSSTSADAGTSLEYPSASEVVVIYCTIGYRSGLEAQRLRHKYALVDPNTQQPTTKVHVFGSMWDVASDGFQTVWFSKFDMVLRGIEVGVKAFLGVPTRWSDEKEERGRPIYTAHSYAVLLICHGAVKLRLSKQCIFLMRKDLRNKTFEITLANTRRLHT
eukprot:scaffold4826_cov274-Chaetoceros_neogracile.AAC.14